MIRGHTRHTMTWNDGVDSEINPSPQNENPIINSSGWLYKMTLTQCVVRIFFYFSTTKTISVEPIK